MNNTKTILLLAFLGALVLFLGGFRLGRQVERVDKTYVPPTSIPLPSPTSSPTPTEQMAKFKTFTHSGCGISFLYPDTLMQSKNGSESGMVGRSKSFVSFTCPTKIATQTATLLTPTVTVVNGTEITSYASTDNSDTWSIDYNRGGSPVTKSAKKITFNTSRNLTDLIMRTVSFIK